MVNSDVAEYGLHPIWFIVLPIILWVIATLTVSMRVYVRAFLIRSVGADDYVLFFAYLVFTASVILYAIFGFTQINDGIVFDLYRVSGIALSLILLYLAESIILKIALALFFLRILTAPKPRWIIRICALIYVLYSVAFFFTALFQCGHPSTVDFLGVGSSTCLGWNILGPLNYLAAVLNCVIDWILTITPMFAVFSLQMTTRRKLSVCALMTLGLMGSVVSVARVPFVPTLRITGNLNFFHNTIPICLLSITETAIGIIAISCATFKPLFASLADRSGYSGASGSRFGFGTKGKSNVHTANSQKGSAMRSQQQEEERKILATTSFSMVINEADEDILLEDMKTNRA